MKDVFSSEDNLQHQERRRHSESPDNRQTFSERPEYIKAGSWSILFRATSGPMANWLKIEKWRASLPSI